jgi:hypothetical protein
MQRNQKILEFLKTLSDFELANFYFYKYDTFMEYSKKIIDDFLKSRGIDDHKIKQIVKEVQDVNFSDNEHRCPQCSSLKKIRTTQQYCPVGYGAGIAAQLSENITMVDLEECLICGYKFPARFKR